MGDADARGLIQRALIEIVRQLGVGLLIPAHLAAGNDVARLVAAQDGLDAEHRADQRRRAGDAPAALEVVEIVHREELAHVGAARENAVADLLKAPARAQQLRRLEHLQALAERGGIGVDGHDFGVRIFFPQLLRRERRGVRRAADAAGHTDVEHIVALRERAFKERRRRCGVDH